MAHVTDTDPSLQLRCFDVVVVDDMLSAGWGQVIAGIFSTTMAPRPEYSSDFALFAKSASCRVYGASNPDPLLRALSGSSESGHAAGDCALAPFITRSYSSILPTPDEGNRPWLLVLDLKLHAGRRSEELQWLRKIHDLAEKIGTKYGLAWPGFTSRELQAVRDWLSSPDDFLSERDPEEHTEASDTRDPYITALSLLPRLCALRWPAVPILLFSATGRRELISSMAAYRNILDAPAKPDLLDPNADQRIAAFYAGWKERVGSVKGYLDVQRSLLELKSRKATLTHDNIPSTCRHITIAFDEAGKFEDQASAVGGVIVEASGETAEKARTTTRVFFECFRARGARFYHHAPLYSELGFKVGKHYEDAPKKKHDHVHKELAGALKGAQSKVKLGVFRCMISPTDAAGAAGADGAYLQCLISTIEFLLCEHLPSLGYDAQEHESTTKLSIWLPTRWIKGEPAQAARLDLLMHGERFQTLGGYSVTYQLLLSALKGRQHAEALIQNSSLKLRKIPYYDAPPPGRPESALHWYCDRCKDFIHPKDFERAVKVPTCTKNLAANGPYRACGTRLAPDYSVAQHLADACLTVSPVSFPSDEMGCEHLDGELGFDIEVGEILEDFLACGRYIDEDPGNEKREWLCFERAFRRGFFLEGLNLQFSEKDVRKAGFCRGQSHRRIVDHCVGYSDRLKGEEIAALAGWVNTGGQAQSHVYVMKVSTYAGAVKGKSSRGKFKVILESMLDEAGIEKRKFFEEGKGRKSVDGVCFEINGTKVDQVLLEQRFRTKLRGYEVVISFQEEQEALA